MPVRVWRFSIEKNETLKKMKHEKNETLTLANILLYSFPLKKRNN